MTQLRANGVRRDQVLPLVPYGVWPGKEEMIFY